MKDLMLAISPILVVVLGGALLMLSEAFGKKRSDDGEGGASVDLALGTAVTLFAGAVVSIAVCMAPMAFWSEIGMPLNIFCMASNMS